MTTNFHSRFATAAGAAALAFALAGTAAAQSLGDVAREEAARRQSATTTKVYTNADLGAPEPAPAAATPAAAQSAQSAQSSPASTSKDATPASGADAKKDAKGEPAKKDEAYWRGRLKAARDGKARAESFAEALQSRINALSTDFVNRDDPAQRNAIATDRQKALDELARVKKEIVDFTKAIDDLQTEARHEGVPAGWLR